MKTNQESVVREGLRTRFDPEDIESEIERYNYGDLENVASKHHKVLIKRNL
jgi:hypothetical protein